MRSLALACVLVSVLGSVAFAKPKIAILGLEVVGDLDPEQTKLAKQLTVGLRDRASAGTGPYTLAPNSDKELVDEKLMNNCGSEALTCMTPIGMNLGADYLMYGKIEKVDKGYHLTIKMIRVANKLPMPTFSEIIPIAEIKGDPKAVAKRAYSRVTASDEGTLTVRVANVDRATIYLDDQPVGTTSSGVLTVSVGEGRYRLAVVATERGWKRHEQTLVINAGDSRNIPIELTRGKRSDRPEDNVAAPGSSPGVIQAPGSDMSHSVEGATSDTGASRTGWRMGFAVAVAAGLGSGGLWYYGYRQISDAEKELCTGKYAGPGCTPPGTKKERDNLNEQGDRGKVMTIAGGTLTGISAVVAGYLFYKAFIASDERTAVGGVSARGARPRRAITMAPLIGPSGGGATLRLDW